MTDEEKHVETPEDERKRELRAMLDLLIDEMDTFQAAGIKRSHVKKQVSKYRNLLSNPLRQTREGKWFPTVPEMLGNWQSGHQLQEIINFFKVNPDHAYRVEYARELDNKLTYIDRYEPPGNPPHTDYGQFPLGHHKWVDEQGNDMWNSERKDAKLWVKKHPEVKRWHSKGKE